ncbi:LuxR C-terminal-related transcriptional regulator [Arthrobacter sp. zg-Y40]|uniref:helix-turn-helix domain-containing protein n=1 Tax=Arthrobacter sp. zg-Y40 TaxID=2886939 RepID=UPI001D14654D|nr:helix-turn-helix transcriptional regulator [Arthrobacter sp. zg-Y40]MCC3280165.1 LuxR C-terminal-related transcriptional regulator [Arthrobacter sp. zg-Y40]
MIGSNPRALAGRDDVLSGVLESLRRPGGHGAVIAAEAGLGKTAVAAAAAQELETAMPVHWVYASPALTAVPYGALAALLPDITPEQTGSALAVMRAIMGKLGIGEHAAEPAGSPAAPLLIVDDAHEMDQPTLDLLSQLLDAAQIRLLVLTRTFADVAGTLPHMWDGQLTRHRLLPLTEDEVHTLCEQELPGQVATTASVELSRLTGGNPVYLLALIEEAIRSGFLVPRHGIWVVSEAEVPVGGRVADLVKGRLRALDPEDRSALETICLAEPFDLAAAFRLGMHRSIDRLAAALLIQVCGDAGNAQSLRPLHPIYGEAIRKLVPAARSARLLGKLDGQVPGTGEESLLRWVAWSLSLGTEVPAAGLLRAAEAANNRSDPRLALRAASAVPDGGTLVPARLQEARALLQLGEYEAAAAAAKGTLEEAPDLRTAKQAVVVHAQLAMRAGGDNAWVRPLSVAWRQAIERLSAVEPPGAVARARGGPEMLLVLEAVREGEYVRAESELVDLRARAAEDAEAVLFVEALLAEVLVATGRAVTALTHSSAAMALLQREGSGLLPYYPFVLHRHLTILVWLGQWEEVHRCVGTAGSSAQRSLLHSGGMADFALGLCSLRSSAMEDAARHFAAAVEEAEAANDPEGVLALALGLGSFAAASLGQREQAGRLQQAAEQVQSHGPRQYQVLAAGILSAAKLAKDSDDAAARNLRAQAAAAQESSFTAIEFTLRHLAMRLGDFSDAGRLLKITEGFEGPQAPVVNRVARAVLDQDVNALAALATSREPEMDLLLARQCTLEALRLARKGSDRAVLNRIQRLVGKQGGNGHSSLPGLTRREHDVAELVAAGYRNAEIAGQLDLSVRTVEGHIYRTYEKLGISRRDELKARFPSLRNPAAGWKPPPRGE